MKLLVFSIMITTLLAMNLAFAQTEELISVKTSEKSYEEGDTIVISGQVSSIILDAPMTIQIFHVNSLVEIAQVVVANDGKFTLTLKAAGSAWQEEGTYTVRASYSGQIVETSFDFFTKTSSSETTNIFEVDAGRFGTFDVDYTIRSGTVKNMIIDYEKFALDVILDTDADGTITLDLPRQSIDAKKSDGSDDTFLVYIDGAEVRPEETSTTQTSRILKIEFEEGDSDIEIIGNVLFTTPVTSSMKITAILDESKYVQGDIISVSGKVSPASKSTVKLSISNPLGNIIWTENLVAKSDGVFSTLIIAGGDDWQKTGRYTLTARVGNTQSTTSFTFDLDQSTPDEPKLPRPTPVNTIKILSVEATDQQGNPKSYTRGDMGFVKVVVSANQKISTLLTVNLFDSELTTIGIGSFRTTLGTGESEMILSFLIPDDAATGGANVYANAFSDWPSNGGVPQTGEVSSQERIL